jgi:putative membrane protein
MARARLRRCSARDHEEAPVLLSILIRWALLTLAVVLAAWTVPGVDIRGGALTALWVAVLIAVANVLAHLLIRVLPQPGRLILLAVLTLGLNGLAVWILSAFTSGLHIDTFLDAVSFTLMVTVFSVALGFVGAKVLGR